LRDKSQFRAGGGYRKDVRTGIQDAPATSMAFRCGQRFSSYRKSGRVGRVAAGLPCGARRNFISRCRNPHLPGRESESPRPRLWRWPKALAKWNHTPADSSVRPAMFQQRAKGALENLQIRWMAMRGAFAGPAVCCMEGRIRRSGFSEAHARPGLDRALERETTGEIDASPSVLRSPWKFFVVSLRCFIALVSAPFDTRELPSCLMWLPKLAFSASTRIASMFVRWIAFAKERTFW